MSTKPRTGRVRSVYEFIKAHRGQYSVQAMCRILGVAPSGYYEWLLQPISNRGQEDARLLRLIRASFVASQGIYGAPRVFLDLREAGETCSKHRVARLMREANLRALHGYRIRRWSVGKPSVLIPNLLQRQFTVTRPNKAWVTDVTYIRTWQGWLYLAVVMDLFSRKIVEWAAGPTIHRDLVLNAVLIAVRRRRRPRGTLIHSDQGKYIYYRCTGHRGACGNAYIREEQLGQLLGTVVERVQIPAELADWIAQGIRESQGGAEQAREKALAEATQRRRGVQAKLDRGYDDFLDGRISEGFWTRKSGNAESQGSAGAARTPTLVI